ncbi:MAG: SGNH/GDSL hydrolase family protein [Verrucomicrobiota bacterium]
MKMFFRFVPLSFFFIFLFTSASLLSAKELEALKNSKVAVIGDSITEQKLYARFIELYLTVCQPQLGTSSFQYGWSGEKAVGFLSRMDLDLDFYRPTFATLCYGMNDGLYKPFDATVGDAYEKPLVQIVQKLKKNGAFVVVGGPGAVDSFYFKRIPSEVYNQNLEKLSEIAKKIAADNQFPYADVHGTMMEVMAKAKAALGNEYEVGGGDGIHPQSNGHLIMAYAFLKAMNFDGDLGTITLDYKGESKGVNGHQVKSFTGGKAEIESTRYPFCFSGDKTSPKYALSILPYLPFNRDLNRVTFIVKNAPAPKLSVKWGDQSKTYSREDLEKGINLADEFIPNPFNDSFDKMSEQILQKEAYETDWIKTIYRGFRVLGQKFPGDQEVAAATSVLDKKAGEKWNSYSKEIKASVKPINHTIIVEAVP